MTIPTNKTILLLKFESETCGVCHLMNKKRIVESIAEEFPEMQVIKLTIADKMGDSPEGSDYEKAYALSDELGVNNLPTYIWQTYDGIEIERIEGEAKLTEFRKVTEGVKQMIEVSRAAHPRIMSFVK